MINRDIISSSLLQLLVEGYKEAQTDFELESDPMTAKAAIAAYKELVNRNQVQAEERNIDWWRKQGWEQFKNFVDVKTQTQSATQLKRSKQTGQSVTLEENDQWLIVIPADKTASCYHGKNTDWCTTKPFASQFEEYVFDDDTTLVYFLRIDTGTKWAMEIYNPTSESAVVAIEGMQLYDQKDNKIDIQTFKAQTGLDSKKYKRMALGHRTNPVITSVKKQYRDAQRYIVAHADDTEKSTQMEQALLLTKNTEAIVNYCIKFGRWKQVENLILNQGPAMLHYANYVIRGRWPECEAVLLKRQYRGLARNYIRDVVKDPTAWPEGENLLLQQAEGESTTDFVDRIVSASILWKTRWKKMEQLFRDPEQVNILSYGLTPDLCVEYISECVVGTSEPLPLAIAETALRDYPHIIEHVPVTDKDLVRILISNNRVIHWVTSISKQVYNLLVRIKPTVARELEPNVV